MRFRQYPRIKTLEENETFCQFIATLLNEQLSQHFPYSFEPFVLMKVIKIAVLQLFRIYLLVYLFPPIICLLTNLMPSCAVC